LNSVTQSYSVNSPKPSSSAAPSSARILRKSNIGCIGTLTPHFLSGLES
jgi:hypothetical protein